MDEEAPQKQLGQSKLNKKKGTFMLALPSLWPVSPAKEGWDATSGKTEGAVLVHMLTLNIPVLVPWLKSPRPLDSAPLQIHPGPDSAMTEEDKDIRGASSLSARPGQARWYARSRSCATLASVTLPPSATMQEKRLDGHPSHSKQWS